MKIRFDYFIASTKSINGKDAEIELVVPNVINFTSEFIGLSSGKKYDRATFVSTSRLWDENDLFKQLKKVKRVGFWGNSKKKLLLKRYLEQVVEIREKYTSSVVALDESLNLIRIDSHKNYMNKKTPKLTQESEVKKEAYLGLAKTCLNQEDYLEIAPILENLKNYDGHWKYESTSFFLQNILDRQGIYLFNCFDWKFSIKDFYEFISFIIKKNFDYDIQLKYQDDYPKNATISTEGFFSKYKGELNKESFDFCFKEENSDTYIIVICKIKDSGKVSSFLSKL